MSDGFAISMFGALFAVMNPFVNLPIFLSMTDGQSAADQRKTAVETIFYTSVMCAVVAFFGAFVLKFFGISIDSFRVAGGFVLAQIGLNMLNGKSNHSHHGTDSEQSAQASLNSIAFYPMTFPMLVGPGTITTLIVFANKAHTPPTMISYAIVVGTVLALLAVVLFFAGAIGTYLTQTMRVIMTRIMGMILIAIAVQMLAEGVIALLPGLA